MRELNRTAPTWSAPPTLLPRVLAEIQSVEVSEPRPNLLSMMAVAGLCALVGLGLASYWGLFPQPMAYAETALNHLLVLGRALSVLERGLAVVIGAMLSDVRTLALLALYCALVVPVAFGGVGGVVYLARLNNQPGRLS